MRNMPVATPEKAPAAGEFFSRHVAALLFLVALTGRGAVAAETTAANPGTPGPATGPDAPVVQAVPDGRPQYWFGVAVENISPAYARQLRPKLKPDQGVMILAVFEDSPAAKAGLHKDDILITLNGQPLTSQEELAGAANAQSTQPMGHARAASLMKTSQIEFLRDGELHTTPVTPAPRPASMLVSGINMESFTPRTTYDLQANNVPVRNIVLSNGITASVGPGYQVDSGESLKVLQQAVGKGQTVTITQETDDASGKVKTTLRDGPKSYVLEEGNLQNLPENYRPLVQQFFSNARRAAATPAVPPKPAAGTASAAMEERMRRLEQQNTELLRQIDELKQILTRPAD
jgi:hypothetical protein